MFGDVAEKTGDVQRTDFMAADGVIEFVKDVSVSDFRAECSELKCACISSRD